MLGLKQARNYIGPPRLKEKQRSQAKYPSCEDRMEGYERLAVPHAVGQQFLSLDPLQEALDRLAEAESNVEERGAVFTRKEVVEFMLDLAGYTSNLPLHTKRVLEPSCGQGDFLFAVVERLLKAYFSHADTGHDMIADLQGCVRAVELHRETFRVTREKLGALLEKAGLSSGQATRLLNAWLIQGDFLHTAFDAGFDFVIGNPPYVRQELIADVLLAEYRKRFQTIYDRADLYVPFFEHSLRYLAPGGSLDFICSDRWMKNKYGGPLRKLITEGYHVKYYVDMVDTPAFHSDVIAYPAITVITKEQVGPTRVAIRPPIDTEVLSSLAQAMHGMTTVSSALVTEVSSLAGGSEPWMLGEFDRLAVVRRLEASFPTIEDASCRVGIGVATGADKVFIGPYEAMDVELDRKLPLVMTKDIQSGAVDWHGYGVINPFNDEGGLVDLDKYPKLAAYLERHAEAIKKRNVAQRSPQSWYRTIDRIYPSLVNRPKLLIPDIKGQAHVVHDEGNFYPHHNLYYITSDEWDLKALQSVLLSGIATLFVEAYSTKMAGGFLRFQAQYLRRIRIPRWSDVPDALKAELVRVSAENDTEACNRVVFKLFGLTKHEQVAITGCED
jgi:hypothetical protein